MPLSRRYLPSREEGGRSVDRQIGDNRMFIHPLIKLYGLLRDVPTQILVGWLMSQ